MMNTADFNNARRFMQEREELVETRTQLHNADSSITAAQLYNGGQISLPASVRQSVSNAIGTTLDARIVTLDSALRDCGVDPHDDGSIDEEISAIASQDDIF